MAFWDGVTGFLDGMAGATDSLGKIVSSGTDIRDDLTMSDMLATKARLEREEGEQDLLLEMAGFQRGDNLKLYYVAGAAAVALVLLMR